MSPLGYVLWLLAPVCQIILMIFMLRRKLRADFPFFFTYTLFQVISFAVQYAVYHFWPNQYFDVYWTSSALAVMLGFMVIYETFSYALRKYAGLRDLGKMMFRWVALVLLLVGALLAMSSTGMNSKKIIYALVDIERAIRLMQCGMLAFIFLCSSYLGLTWRNFAAGIALGYGVYACTDLVMFSLRFQFGGYWNDKLSMIMAVTYCLSVLIWVGYSMMPEKALQRVHNDVVYRPIFDRWNQAAMVLTAPMAPNEAAMMEGNHTYLTEIERAVDDIMSQSRHATNEAHD